MFDGEISGADPRQLMSEDDLHEASLRAAPQVARQRGAADGLGLAAGIVGVLAIGAFTFASLTQQRASANAAVHETASAPTPAPPVAEPAPMAIEEFSLPADGGMRFAESSALPMVIDNTGGPAPAVAAEGGDAEGERQADPHEAFALRAGQQTGGVARAVRPGDLSATIVEGTILPAVLETALNSDLPGHARAIVSRDVRSFDGSAVLVPRGSRLIGQYRSAATPGQSRAFIIWSRLIRPDGVSIDLASPAHDRIGAVGLGGDVDRHFLRRFGSALLLSVVGALPALAEGASNTVVIGTNAEAQSAAAQALQTDARIPPTIRVPIGTPIQVFTSRDLVF